MTPNEYQQLAKRTLIDTPEIMPSGLEVMILWNAIGLGGESGEIEDLIKKGILHGHGVDREKLKKELGDCLWYIAGLATQYGFTLEDVMEANIAKLKERYPAGFSNEASINRNS